MVIEGVVMWVVYAILTDFGAQYTFGRHGLATSKWQLVLWPAIAVALVVTWFLLGVEWGLRTTGMPWWGGAECKSVDTRTDTSEAVRQSVMAGRDAKPVRRSGRDVVRPSRDGKHESEGPDDDTRAA